MQNGFGNKYSFNCNRQYSNNKFWYNIILVSNLCCKSDTSG